VRKSSKNLNFEEHKKAIQIDNDWMEDKQIELIISERTAHMPMT